MADGHLNKCKSCCKKDARMHYKSKSKNVWFLEAERRRGREKYQRLNYKEKYPPDPTKSFSATKNLHRNLIAKGFDLYMKEAHHWNYNFPHQGFILSRTSHKLIHRSLILDRISKCFLFNGEMLDTMEKHKNYICGVFKGNGIEEPIIEFDL